MRSAWPRSTATGAADTCPAETCPSITKSGYARVRVAAATGGRPRAGALVAGLGRAGDGLTRERRRLGRLGAAGRLGRAAGADHGGLRLERPRPAARPELLALADRLADVA